MFRFNYKYPDPLTDGSPANIPQNIYIVGVALVIGLMTGTMAEGLKYLVEIISRAVTSGVDPLGWNWIFIVLPVAGILLAVLYQRYVVRQQIAHGVERMTRLLHTDRPWLPVSQIWSPVIASGLTLGFGGSAGTEGPIATAGGAIGSNMARWCGMPAPMVRAMLVIGAGAGIAGIFKAPVGGMLFAIEVLGITMSALQLLALATACTAAGLAAYILSGLTTDVTFPDFTHVNLTYVPWALIIGVFCGMYSVYYSKLARWTRRILEKIGNSWVRNITSGLTIGVLICLFPRLYGEGYTFLTDVLSGRWDLMTSSSLFAGSTPGTTTLILLALAMMTVKSAAVACTTSGGGVAGDFAPAIFAGCIAGFFFALTANTLFGLSLPVADCAFIGMAAVLAGAVRAPLMAMFLVTEMVAHFSLLLPVAVASSMSYMMVCLLDRPNAPKGYVS